MQGVAVPDSRSELTEVIGRNIRLARVLAGMSQLAVVRAQRDVVPLDRKTREPVERLFTDRELSVWENGHRRPSDGYLARIATITGQPFAWFYEPHGPEGQ